MLDNLIALKNYTRRMGEKLPALKNEIVLKSPGISQSDCARLKDALPNLPDSYLRCIQLLDAKGVFMGYFRLWPMAAQAADMVESLVQINRPGQNPFFNTLRELNLYEVAAWEAEPIWVASKNHL